MAFLRDEPDEEEIRSRIVMKDKQVIGDVRESLVGGPRGADCLPRQIDRSAVRVAHTLKYDLKFVGQVRLRRHVSPVRGRKHFGVKIGAHRIERKVVHIGAGINLKAIEHLARVNFGLNAACTKILHYVAPDRARLVQLIDLRAAADRSARNVARPILCCPVRANLPMN